MITRPSAECLATLPYHPHIQHESIKTTYIYRTPIPPSNKKAIDRIAPIGTKPGRYRPSDALLAFL